MQTCLSTFDFQEARVSGKPCVMIWPVWSYGTCLETNFSTPSPLWNAPRDWGRSCMFYKTLGLLWSRNGWLWKAVREPSLRPQYITKEFTAKLIFWINGFKKFLESCLLNYADWGHIFCYVMGHLGRYHFPFRTVLVIRYSSRKPSWWYSLVGDSGGASGSSGRRRSLTKGLCILGSALGGFLVDGIVAIILWHFCKGW